MQDQTYSNILYAQHVHHYLPVYLCNVAMCSRAKGHSH